MAGTTQQTLSNYPANRLYTHARTLHGAAAARASLAERVTPRRRYWRRHRGHARPQRARDGGAYTYARQNHGCWETAAAVLVTTADGKNQGRGRRETGRVGRGGE